MERIRGEMKMKKKATNKSSSIQLRLTTYKGHDMETDAVSVNKRRNSR
jgi:hypothetical protein